MRTSVCVAACLFVFLCCGLRDENSNLISLNEETIRPGKHWHWQRAEDATSHALRFEKDSEFDPSQSQQILVQTKPSSTLDDLQQLEAALNIKLGFRFPHSAFHSVAVPAQIQAVLESKSDDVRLKVLQWVGPYLPRYRTLGGKQLLSKKRNVKQLSSPALDNVNKRNSVVAMLAPPESGSERSESEVEELLASWTTLLGKKLRNVSVHSLSSTMAVVESQDTFARILSAVARLSTTFWVEPRPAGFSPHNRFASQLVQGSSASDLATPFWKQGIRGDNEILGLVDTGVDFDNCLLSDPLRNSAPRFGLDTTYRKIVRYDTPKLYLGDPLNHGTSVAGTMVGEPADPNSPLNAHKGIAYKAKLYFRSNEFVNDTVRPTLQSILSPLWSVGVRIIANPWGESIGSYGINCTYDCKCFQDGVPLTSDDCVTLFGVPDCCRVANRYSTLSYEVDQFAHRHQDTLLVWSAGNDGEAGGEGNVPSPATCKNCLTVGATQTTAESFQNMLSYKNYAQIRKDFGNPTTSECCTIPRFYACCPARSATHFADLERYNADNVASWSSRGTRSRSDLAIKPDLLVPGYAVSAFSDGDTSSNNCLDKEPSSTSKGALEGHFGTSTAAGVAAGAAALVRQYFREGFYPSGVQNLVQGFEPSAILIKAIMIHGGRKLSGVVDVDGKRNLKELPNTLPNKIEGFGALRLSTVLPLANNFHLTLMSGVLDHQQTITYCFATKHPTRVKATLAYADPPGNPASFRALRHDLDLSVRHNKPTAAIPRRGNDVIYGIPDVFNNVEVVEVDMDSSEIAFSVYAQWVDPGTTQSFVLVVTSGRSKLEPYETSSLIPGRCTVSSFNGRPPTAGSDEQSQDADDHDPVILDGSAPPRAADARPIRLAPPQDFEVAQTLEQRLRGVASSRTAALWLSMFFVSMVVVFAL